MIIHKQTKEFQSRSDKPISNWIGSNEYFVVADNSILYNEIISLYPRFDFIIKDGELVDVIEIPKTQEEINIERMGAIEIELKELDTIIPRCLEDWYMEEGKKPSIKFREDAITRKVALRTEMATLKK